MKKVCIKMMLESLFWYYKKPDPISGLMYVVFWLVAPESYYMNLSLAQHYCACDKGEKEEIATFLANYNRS